MRRHAFPDPIRADPEVDSDGGYGMTLRQYYAAQALPATILCSTLIDIVKGFVLRDNARVPNAFVALLTELEGDPVEMAFLYADVMLEADDDT